MDSVRLGAVIRALRRRRRWRQRDLGRSARLSQQSVSRIERGRLEGVDLATIDRVAVALDARLDVRLAWRGGELDRLLDERHAALVEAVVGRLSALGWQTAVEVTYAEYAERGAIDVMAWFPARRALLVVEVKTMLASIEATHRRHDEKVRLAATIARKRFGYLPLTVSRLLVLPDDSTARRHVARHGGTFDSVLPGRGLELRRWLHDPVGSMRGVWFLAATHGGSGRTPGNGPCRIRRGRDDQLQA
jgi:transcriptional regulator with XRE-family HTH domain